MEIKNGMNSKKRLFKFILYKIKLLCFHLKYYFFQKYGVKMIRTVNNSNLPISIKNDKRILAKSDKCAKFDTGPTVPMPGPTFPKQVALAPMDVKKSIPETESKIDERTNIKI